MQQSTSRSSVVNSSNDSNKSKMENIHQKMLENTVDRSIIIFCKENTLTFVDEKCLQAMNEVAELG